jgi:hypothetical protein
MQITMEIPDTLGQQWQQFDHPPGFGSDANWVMTEDCQSFEDWQS